LNPEDLVTKEEIAEHHQTKEVNNKQVNYMESYMVRLCLKIYKVGRISQTQERIGNRDRSFLSASRH
jgi:hypothetical protein